MVILNPNEARTYESIKQGLLPREIAAQMGKHPESIRLNMLYLIRVGMVVKHGRNKRYRTYTVVDVPYEVGKRPRAQPSTPKKPKMPPINQADPFLEAALSVTLTDDERLYLTEHRGKQPRKVLCQRTGLTRLQLNFILERLG